MSIKRPSGVYGKKVCEELAGGEAKVAYAIFLDDGKLTAFCPEFNLVDTSSDIAVLRKSMKKMIDEKIAFKWEAWLEVTVVDFKNTRAMFSGTGDKMQLGIKIRRFEISERNGEPYWREPGSASFMKGKKEPKGRHSTSSWGGTDNGEEFSSTALIRDTPEARAALEQLQVGMDALSSKVMMVLSQSNIEKAIAGLLTSGGSLLALPAPKKGK